MRILCLDTSTLAGSIALIEDESVRAEINLNLGRKHTERLLPAIDRMFAELGLAPKDINAVAVGIGPGSFTGLRVGLAAAKGLALSLSIPIVGILSLDALAWQIRFYDGPILALLDARKGQVFARFYKGGGSFAAQGDAMAINPESLLPRIPDRTLIVGEGGGAYQEIFSRLKDKIRIAGFEFDHPRAAIIGRLGLERLKKGESDSLDSLTPVYLRPSDAEISRLEAG